MDSHYCPECSHDQNVPATYANRKVKCKWCGHEFTACDATRNPPPPKPKAPAPPFFSDDFPALGATLLVLGIIITFIGCVKDVSFNGVANLNAVSIRQNIVIIGCTWSVIGSLFIAVHTIKSGK